MFLLGEQWSVPNDCPRPAEEVRLMIEQVQKDYSDLDVQNVYYLLLDNDFDLNRTLASAMEVCTTYDDFFKTQQFFFSPKITLEEPEPVVTPNANKLQEIYPEFSMDRIIDVLKSKHDDIDQANEILANDLIELPMPKVYVPHKNNRKRKKQKKNNDYPNNQYIPKPKIKVQNELNQEQQKKNWKQNKQPLTQTVNNLLLMSINRSQYITDLSKEFPLVPDSEINKVLIHVQDDMDKARFILAQNHGFDQNIMELHRVFPNIPIEQIRQIYNDSFKNKQVAANVIADLQIDNPYPIDLLMALFPDFPDQFLNDLFIEANYDVDKAILLAQKAKSRQNRNIKTERVKELTINLHCYTKTEAQQLISQILIKAPKSNIKTINFITGKGKHSQDNIPVIRPLVLLLCNKYQVPAKIDPRNAGVVIADFSRFP